MSKISAQDQALLNTDFGEDMEKEAAARVAACQEAYAYGCEKLAADAAEEMDKKEEEDKKEDKKEEKMDEESEKAAAELGAFIERGFFDGLRKLGSERHGDEMHYLTPYILEKAAAMGAKEMFRAIDPRRAINEIREGAKSVGRSFSKDLKEGTGGYSHLAGNEATRKEIAKKALKGGAKDVGMGLARLSPYAATAGLGAYGVSKAVGGKKQEAKQ